MFDRVTPRIELGYDKDDVAQGREIRSKITWDAALADVAAALGCVAGAGKAAVVGYCWGGSVAWLAARRHNLAAAVCYYGGDLHERSEDPIVVKRGVRTWKYLGSNVLI